MFLIEGGSNPNFASIPDSVYWAVTTMTTVGYGDITPLTTPGRILATLIMIMGYGIIAVPTGIVTLELNEANRRRANTKTCPMCSAEGTRPTKPVFAGVAGPIFIQTHRMMAEYHVRAWV